MNKELEDAGKALEEALDVLSFDKVMMATLLHLQRRGHRPARNGPNDFQLMSPIGLPLDFYGAVKVEMNEWFRHTMRGAK